MGCTILNSAADERVIDDGLGLFGTVLVGLSDEVEGVASFLRDGIDLLFPE